MRTPIDRIMATVCGTPWAILPEKLEEIMAFLEARADGQDIPVEELRARFQPAATPASGKAKGVAVLPLWGTITHRAGMIEAYSGGTSTETFQKMFDGAVADSAIGHIVLDVNSPGGSVSGVPELADHIRQARDASGKNIIAVANPLMASAAYFLAAQAHEVVVMPSGKVGAIGVFAVHRECSRMEEKQGIRTTIVSAGKYKTEGNPYEPLSEDARRAAQETVDEYYRMFVDAVAAGRNVSAAKVVDGFGQGRVLTARAALKEGLVDRIATLQEVLEGLGVQADVIRETVSTEPYLEAADALDREILSSIAAVADDLIVLEELRSYPDANTRTFISAATATIGVGGPLEPPPNHTAPAAKEEKVDAEKTTDQAPKGPDIALVRDAEANERKRAAEITELCHLHRVPEKASRYIADGKTVAEVGMDLARERFTVVDPMNPPEPRVPKIDMGRKDREKYSLGLAVKELLTGKPGLGHEVSDALRREMPEGFVSQGGDGKLPSVLIDIQGFRAYRGMEERAAGLDTGTDTAGAELVFTEPGSFIELLRNRSVCLRMGAQRLPGLVGNIAFPSQDGAGAGAWIGDNSGSDVTGTDLTLTQVTMSPKIYQQPIAYSRLLERQSVVALQRIVEDDILQGHALAIDLASLHGASGGDGPVGVYAITGVNAVAFGGVPTFAKVVEMESALVVDNAPLEKLGYAFTPEVAGLMKTTDKGSTYDTGQYLWEGPVADGIVNGYKAMATNQLSKVLGTGTDEHGAVFANWGEMIIGEWGTLEIVLDPYTLKKQGLIELCSYQTADVALRHAVSFCKATGLTIA